MDKLRIYLVDDHKLFREGLKLYFQRRISFAIFTRLQADENLLKICRLLIVMSF